MVVVSCISCQTTKIKNRTYKLSSADVELGNIGQSKSTFNLQNDFETRTIAKLENKIRVAIEILPFTRKLNKIYKGKAKFNQNQSKLTYIDSLPTKPELVIIHLLDVTGFLNELNADYNKEVVTFLKDTKNTEIVSNIAVVLSNEIIVKIRQADTYYLINNQDRKYVIALYKQGKKIETIDVDAEAVLGYRLSAFCWSVTERGNWYIADMVEAKNRCMGNTKSKIHEKEKMKNLYKM